MNAADWIADLARLADAAPVQHQRLRVGGEGSEGTRVYPDTGDKRTDIRALLVVNGLGQPEDGQMARFIAAANPATILRLIAENRDLSERLAQAYRDEVLAHDERAALAARLAAVEAELQQQRHRTAEFQTIAAGFANRAVAAEDRLAAVEALSWELSPADGPRLRAVLSAAPTDPPDLETP